MASAGIYPAHQAREPTRGSLAEAATMRDGAARQLRLLAPQQPKQRRALRVARDSDSEIRRRRIGGPRGIHRQSVEASADWPFRRSARERVSGTDPRAADVFLDARRRKR